MFRKIPTFYKTNEQIGEVKYATVLKEGNDVFINISQIKRIDITKKTDYAPAHYEIWIIGDTYQDTTITSEEGMAIILSNESAEDQSLLINFLNGCQPKCS